MKVFLTILFLINAVRLYGQLRIEPFNFYWQRVVEYHGDMSELRSRIEASGVISNIQKSDSTIIVGKVDNVVLKYSSMKPKPTLPNKPIYFSNGINLSGTLSYEFKDGRYRVTFRNIAYKSPSTYNIAGVQVEMGEIFYNDVFFNKKGEFRRGEKARDFAEKVFDYSFSKSFIFEKQSENDQEW